VDVPVLVSPAAGRGTARQVTDAVLAALRSGGLEHIFIKYCTRE
jgi:hypothetical protein